MSSNSKSRGWVFTVNHYTDDDRAKVLALEPPSSMAVCAELEVGDSGTPHIQGAVYFKNPRTLTGVRRLIPRAHWEPMRGSWQQASEYCRKGDASDRLVDAGEGPRQGQRSDLVAFKDAIKAGKPVIDILDEFPVECIKYWRSMQQIRDEVMFSKNLRRTWMTKGLWLHGPTATGKSHRAFEGFDPSHTYVHNVTDKGWWDGYDPEAHHTVILNDFRGELTYQQMLNLVDKWPYSVSSRSVRPRPFLARKVIVTSSNPPELTFIKRADEDSIEQLKRRFKIVELTEKIMHAAQEIEDMPAPAC